MKLSPKLHRKIQMYQNDGYRIKKEETDHILLVKPRVFCLGSLGMHLVIMLFTAWFTLFLGNVAYLFYQLATRKKKKIFIN